MENGPLMLICQFAMLVNYQRVSGDIKTVSALHPKCHKVSKLHQGRNCTCFQRELIETWEALDILLPDALLFLSRGTPFSSTCKGHLSYIPQKNKIFPSTFSVLLHEIMSRHCSHSCFCSRDRSDVIFRRSPNWFNPTGEPARRFDMRSALCHNA